MSVEKKTEIATKFNSTLSPYSYDGRYRRPDGVRPNVRAALDYLDNILIQGGDDARELWDVLSALRGPDEDDRDSSRYGVDLKNVITIPIRRAAFPKMAQQFEMAGRDYPGGYRLNGAQNRATFGRGDERYRGPRDGYEADSHFLKHGVHAARALGLV